MRFLAALSVIFAICTATMTHAAEGTKPRKSQVNERQDTNRRPSTVDHRGLCQRDNGRPSSSLDLNQRCDREEFFQRFNDLGGNRH